MAKHNKLQLHCDFPPRSKLTLSKPWTHAAHLDLTSQADVILTPETLPGKVAPHVSAEESLSTASTVEPTKIESSEWKPSFFRIGPLIGLAALLLSFLQVFASYAVLNLSNGRSVADWKFKPSVYIAILTVVSNGAISFAVAQGAVVTFWLRALQGTTLGQLQRDWAYGSQIYYALSSGKHVNLLAMASIFATLVCIDGPLLQRASSTQPVTSAHSVHLNVSIVPELPSYFSGRYNAQDAAAEFSNAMIPVMNEYSSNTPITSGIKGCDGTCTTRIRAPALIVHHCKWDTSWKNFSAPYTTKEKAIYSQGSLPFSRNLFVTSLTSRYGTTETLDFQTYLTGNEVAETCAGPVYSTHCYLRSAIAEYDVRVVNETITLEQPANPTLISWANNTAITNETITQFDLRQNQAPHWIKTTLGGIVSLFSLEYAFEGTAYPPTKPGVLDISVQSQSWFMYQQTTNYQQYNDHKACTLAWKDPRPTVMAGLNELMFRIGVHVAKHYEHASLEHLLDPGVQTNYTAIGTLQAQSVVFKSEFVYYFAAAALQILTTLIVASTFFGFWELGRHVSFSPLEIAKAFDAPLLAGLDSNLRGRDIASLTGFHEVQYGEVRNSVLDRKAGVMMIMHRQKEHEPNVQDPGISGHGDILGEKV